MAPTPIMRGSSAQNSAIARLWARAAPAATSASRRTSNTTLVLNEANTNWRWNPSWSRAWLRSAVSNAPSAS